MADDVTKLEHSRPYDDAIGELWWNLLQRPRRALCALACIDDSAAETYRWKDLPVDHRTRLVRAMRELAEVSVECAVALERAHSQLRPTNARN